MMDQENDSPVVTRKDVADARGRFAQALLRSLGDTALFETLVVRGEREMIAGLRSLRHGGEGLHDA